MGCSGDDAVHKSPHKMRMHEQNLLKSVVSVYFKVNIIYNLIKNKKEIHVDAALAQCHFNAVVNGHVELNLLKGRRRFDAISTLNLKVCSFPDW